MRFFDPDDDVLIIPRRLPHWSQAGTVCFVTWRTKDSIPKEVLDGWYTARRDWLGVLGIHVDQRGWKAKLYSKPKAVIAEFHDRFTHQWDHFLDDCQGACVLRNPDLSAIVSKSLLHFDGERYAMHDFVIMPNHVHLLVSFPNKEDLLTQCDSWKHFTAREINKRLGQRGRFWQQDAFDHLVRHERQFERLRGYIAENPGKAGLKNGEFVHYSK